MYCTTVRDGGGGGRDGGRERGRERKREGGRERERKENTHTSEPLYSMLLRI